MELLVICGFGKLEMFVYSFGPVDVTFGNESNVQTGTSLPLNSAPSSHKFTISLSARQFGQGHKYSIPTVRLTALI